MTFSPHGLEGLECHRLRRLGLRSVVFEDWHESACSPVPHTTPPAAKEVSATRLSRFARQVDGCRTRALSLPATLDLSRVGHRERLNPELRVVQLAILAVGIPQEWTRRRTPPGQITGGVFHKDNMTRSSQSSQARNSTAMRRHTIRMQCDARACSGTGPHEYS